MDGFTPARARLYLIALVVWWADLVRLLLHFGGSGVVTTPVEAVQLTAMFASCGAICGIAWLMTRDAAPPYRPVGLIPAEDHMRFAMSFVLRFWLMMLGGGVLSALRTLR